MRLHLLVILHFVSHWFIWCVHMYYNVVQHGRFSRCTKKQRQRVKSGLNIVVKNQFLSLNYGTQGVSKFKKNFDHGHIIARSQEAIARLVRSQPIRSHFIARFHDLITAKSWPAFVKINICVHKTLCGYDRSVFFA